MMGTVADRYVDLVTHVVKCLATLRAAELQADGEDVVIATLADESFLLMAYVLVDWPRLVGEVEAKGGDAYLSRLVNERD